MDYNHEGHACKINTWQKKLAVTVIAVGTGVILYFIIQAAMADTANVQNGAMSPRGRDPEKVCVKDDENGDCAMWCNIGVHGHAHGCEMENDEMTTLTRMPRALAKKDCGMKVTIDEFGREKIVEDPDCTPICSVLPTLQRCRETKYWVQVCEGRPELQACVDFCCEKLAEVEWIDDGKIGVAYDYHPACNEVWIYYGTCRNNDELVKKGFRLPNKNWNTYRHGEVYEERMKEWIAAQ